MDPQQHENLSSVHSLDKAHIGGGADPHHADADVDPEPPFNFDADLNPGPTPHQNDGNLTQVAHRPFTASL
jgi:hypothetical protein